MYYYIKCMCIYTYMLCLLSLLCVHVCVYIYIYTYMYIYIYYSIQCKLECRSIEHSAYVTILCLYIHPSNYLYIYIYRERSIYTSIFVCIYIYIYRYIYIYIRIHIHIYIYIYTGHPGVTNRLVCLKGRMPNSGRNQERERRDGEADAKTKWLFSEIALNGRERLLLKNSATSSILSS